jgi:putative hydrolase of the HAD superfamily
MSIDPNRTLRNRIRALSSPLEPRPTAAEPVTDPLDGIRAVLFDIYGTLVISASGDIGLAGEQNEEHAFLAALDAAGVEPPTGAGPAALKDAIRRFHYQRKAAGVAFPEVNILVMWREVLGGGSPLPGPLPQGEEDDADADVAKLAVEYECRVNPVWPMPGLEQVLAEIHGRGLILGIVSNAQFYTPLMLEAFLDKPLDELGFDPACCAFSYRLLEAKPSTGIYHQALYGLIAEHGIQPQEVLYVGNDIRNDVWPAAQVGCRTVLFAGDERSLRLREDDPCCCDVVPDRTVTDLRQITDSILR